MRSRKFAPLALGGVLVTLIAVVFAAIGGSAGQAAPEQGAYRVAMVTDIGGLNDRSFNQLANTGRKRVDKVTGIETRVFNTRTAAERVPNMTAAATQGFDLVIAVGFLNFEALNAIATRFPNVKFVGIDIPYAVLEDKPANVRGVVFKEQNAGYLVGYLAGLTVKRKGGRQVVGAVGANNVPAIVRFIGGYKAGVKRANRGATVLVNYANDPTFSDQAKCKEQALSQIQRGAQIIFQVAGGCGLGVHSAAKERRIQSIGVDADQLYLGNHVLTSALKDVAKAFHDTAREGQRTRGNFRTRFDKVFPVGYGAINRSVPAADKAKLAAIKKLVLAGKIKVPAK